jgi:pimeloyl-ACP methyl ester carboxylesterase
VAIEPVEVDVSAVVPFPGQHYVRGWTSTPDAARAGGSTVIVACCLAGGTCSSEYFDLRVEGYPGYSMAEHLAARGIVTIALDHLGVGTSSPVDDIYRLTPQLVSAVNDAAFRNVLARLASSTDAPLMAVGVGHSMGGMLVTVQQSRHRTFDALAVLGHGGDGLGSVLTDDEAALEGNLDDMTEAIVQLARARFSNRPRPRRGAPVPGSFLAEDVPVAVRKAFMRQQTSLLFTCGLTSMIPNATDDDKAEIDVPVFLGFGERDLTTDFDGSVERYPGADVTLYVVPGSAHCHNQSSNRVLLWDEIATWAERLRRSRTVPAAATKEE